MAASIAPSWWEGLLLALTMLLAAGAYAAATEAASPLEPGSSNTEKAAMVIVEPRPHNRLQYVLQNFNANMPPHYDLYIFHGRAATTAEAARMAAAGIERSRAVHLVPLAVDDLSVDQYNTLLKSRTEFWDMIDAKKVLVFQTDTVLCSASGHNISAFEHLGYIGCMPVYDNSAGPASHWRLTHPYYAFWGSGGLSFRRKGAALACLATLGKRVKANYPEDTFYSQCVAMGHGMPPPNGTWLSEFCSQDTFAARSFGAHRLYDRMALQQQAKFLEYCPEAVPLVHHSVLAAGATSGDNTVHTEL